MASAQIDELTAIGHHYCVRTIQLAVQQVVVCGSSLRGVQKTFELYTDSEEIATPSFSSIRKWLGRIGLYELHRKKEYRSDWVFRSRSDSGTGNPKSSGSFGSLTTAPARTGFSLKARIRTSLNNNSSLWESILALSVSNNRFWTMWRLKVLKFRKGKLSWPVPMSLNRFLVNTNSFPLDVPSNRWGRYSWPLLCLLWSWRLL